MVVYYSPHRPGTCPEIVATATDASDSVMIQFTHNCQSNVVFQVECCSVLWPRDIRAFSLHAAATVAGLAAAEAFAAETSAAFPRPRPTPLAFFAYICEPRGRLQAFEICHVDV